MSKFNVSLWRVESVADHPNADRLQIVHLRNLTYQFVVAKGEYAPGQLVAYFPLDSLIPNSLAAILGLPIKEMAEQFRVKSIRLRGLWSEGVLAPLSVIGIDHKIAEDGLDLTEKLGVTKHDPELSQNVFKGIRPENLQALPTTVHRYDIENLQRYPGVFEALKNEVVFITEKLEGSHWWARIDRDGQTLHVGQRNFEIKRGEEMDKPHPFWSQLYNQNFDDLLYWLSREMPGYDITIRGEIIGEGIQGNYYGLSGRQVYLFELELNGEPVASQQFFDLYDAFRSFLETPVYTVPVLSQWNTLGELFPTLEVVIAKANGKSKINGDKLREGIVIKPAHKEMYNVEIGRLFIKIRDAAYLAQ